MSTGTDAAPVVTRLSTLDRLLPVWIVAAMVLGLLAGRLIPGLGPARLRPDDHVGGRIRTLLDQLLPATT